MDCIKERENRKLQLVIIQVSHLPIPYILLHESVLCYVLTQPSSDLVVHTPHCKMRLTYSVEKRDKGL